MPAPDQVRGDEILGRGDEILGRGDEILGRGDEILGPGDKIRDRVTAYGVESSCRA